MMLKAKLVVSSFDGKNSEFGNIQICIKLHFQHTKNNKLILKVAVP